MTDPITIRIAIEPRGKGRPRFGKGRPYTDPETRKYEETLAWFGKEAMKGRRPLSVPLAVTVVASMSIPTSWTKRDKADAAAWIILPTGTPDVDNILKSLDAFNGIVWTDDRLIVRAEISKRYDRSPGLLITVEPLADRKRQAHDNL